MLPTRRLMLIIATILAMALSFLFYIISTNSPVSSGYVNNFHAELVLEEEVIPEGIQTKLYYVIGDRDDAVMNIVIENVTQALTYMKLNYIEMKQVALDDLATNPVLIFCSDKPNTYMSLVMIGEYISNGGKALFAAGLPDDNDASYLYPLWGIIEKGNRVETNEFHYRKDVIPYSEITVTYPGYNASTYINLNKQVSILIETKEGPPLLYSHEYQKGKVAVINGTLLDRKYSESIICSAIGELTGDLIYPIIGTKTVFLDEYPPIQSMNQDKSVEFYGSAAGSFLRDVLWPKLLQSATLYDLKYTVGILGASNNEEETLSYNERLVKYLIKEVLKYSGEVMFMGDFSSTEEFDDEILSSYSNEFYEIFPNYRISGYAFLYGIADSNEMLQIRKNFEHLYTIRGVYDGDLATQSVQNFEYKDDFVHFPVISSGFGANKEGYYQFLSGLTLQGVISHSFNVHSLFTTKEKNWDNMSESYSKMNRDFFAKTKWLTSSTMSESAKSTLAYDKLSMSVQYEEEKIQVYCNNFLQGQAFYLRTNREVKDVIGGSFSKINDKYYFIQAENAQFTVQY